MIDSLLSKRLIFVTGKGGVGKSSMCAALGLAVAERGKNVLIIETDTYSAMADLFQAPAQNLNEPKRVRKNLHLLNLQSEDALIHIIRQFVPSTRISKAVIQNRVARVFFRAAPSVNEFSILNRVRSYLDLKDARNKFVYDHIIIDLPASGHAVTFLNVPETLHGMIRVGNFAKLAREVADFIQDPTRCAIVAVAIPEEMPVNETIELSESINENLQRPLTLVLLNMVHYPPFHPKYRETFEQMQDSLTEEASPVQRLIQGNDLAFSWYERDLKYKGILHDALSCPVIDIPMFYETDGAIAVERAAQYLNDPEPEPEAQAPSLSAARSS